MVENKLRKELQEEALTALKNNNYTGWSLTPTGSGKSWILIQALKDINPKGKIHYVCDSVLNRDITFKNELIKWGAEKYIPQIEFMCYQTACKRTGGKVELGLFDEADFAACEIYSKSFTNHKYKHKILVSATLSVDKRVLAKKIAPIVYEKDLNDIEGEGIVNESRYFVVNYMLTPQENFKYTNFNARFVKLFNTNGRQSEIEQTQILRRLFLSTLQSSTNTCKRLLNNLYKDDKRKILIFCGVSKQADAICKYSYHSNNNNIEAFKDFDKGKIRVLAVVGKVDRGINIDGVNTIIFEAPPKSNTKWQQKSGRGRRLDVDEVLDVYFLVPYYIDKYKQVKPTVVEKYVYESVGKLNIKPTIIDLIKDKGALSP